MCFFEGEFCEFCEFSVRRYSQYSSKISKYRGWQNCWGFRHGILFVPCKCLELCVRKLLERYLKVSGRKQATQGRFSFNPKMKMEVKQWMAGHAMYVCVSWIALHWIAAWPWPWCSTRSPDSWHVPRFLQEESAGTIGGLPDAKAIVRHFWERIEIHEIWQLHQVAVRGGVVRLVWTACAAQHSMKFDFDEPQNCDATCLGNV